MTVFIPSTTVTVQRGEGVDAWGDPVDVPTVVATGVPACITEVEQRRYRPAEQRTTLVERFDIRLRPNAVVQEEDRLVDERTGVIYQAQNVTYPHQVIGAADVRVSAVRTGALSQPVNG